VFTGEQLRKGHGLDAIPVPISTPGWDNAPYTSSSHFITADPDTGVQFGLVGHVGQVLLGVDGDLVTLPGELAGELAEPDVVTVGAGAGTGVQWRRVLGY